MANYFAEKANNNLSTKGYEFFNQINEHQRLYVSPHIHTAVELLYFVEGEFKICTGNEEHLLGTGDAVMFRSNELHRVYAMSSHGMYYVVKFSPAFIMDLAGTDFGPSFLLSLSIKRGKALVFNNTLCKDTGLCSAMNKLIAESELSDNCSELGMKICVSQVLLILLRHVASQQQGDLTYGSDPQFAQTVYETVAFIEQNYALDISVEECAKRANVSYSYFSRKFKIITGKSFKQYLTDVRLDHAEKALCLTDKPITDISTDCGFNSMAYFSAVYKKRAGCTPSATREALAVRR